jgi:transcriptional regulator with GAF, ATPase, and Fis domain
MNSLKDKITEMELEEIVSALKQNNWVMAGAARMLGITERMIGYKMKKLGLRKKFGIEEPEEKRPFDTAPNYGGVG